MARRRLPQDRQRDRARQAAQRMVARGERLGFHLVVKDGRYGVLEAPWVSVGGSTRSEALRAARAGIAEWLEVPADAFDLET